jgi:hypothetical protein
MKKAKNTLLLILCGALCAVFLSCATGGGGGAPAEGVLGNWTLEGNNDANDGGTSTITMEVAEEEIDGRTVTTYRFFGEVTDATQYGTVDATLTPDEETLALLRTARAISFRMVADGRRYIVEAPIHTVVDWGFHRFPINTSEGAVEEHYIEMRFFMQPSWAQEVRFNRNHLTSIRIQTVNAAEGGVGPFDFKIWDIKLYP